MKIRIEKYNPKWIKEFKKLKNELSFLLKFLNPKIEHIGSTSIQFLSAKPIIDIAIGVNKNSELDLTINPMIKNKFIYYEVYNKVMAKRRFFVGLKNKNNFRKFKGIYSNNEEIPHKAIQNFKMCHIHIWKFGTTEWKRHIAFRDYLKEHSKIKKEYEILKLRLSEKNWIDGNEYNMGKNDFIKKIESEAILWYDKLINTHS